MCSNSGFLFLRGEMEIEPSVLGKLAKYCSNRDNRDPWIASYTNRCQKSTGTEVDMPFSSQPYYGYT